MTEEIVYRDGNIVWVKMNKLWWPGEVHGSHRLPNDFFEQFKKPPLVVVKFFQEHNYHFVNQLNQIAQFNCAKKSEFIKKGLDLYYAKHQCMEKFPADVAMAETRTGGNPNIIYNKEFMPVTKPDNSKLLGSTSKGTSSRSRRGQQNQISTPISIPRVMIKADHHPRILATAAASPSPTVTASDMKYKCNLCNFGTNRINTFVWHQKSHSSPKTPQRLSISDREPTFTQNTIDIDAVKSTATANSSLTDEHIDLDDDTTTDSMPVVKPKKSSTKRQRQTIKSASKSTEKKPKTENKLKTILDDWSDDDVDDEIAGPSGKEAVGVIVLDTDEEDDVKSTHSLKKKFKFSNDNMADNTENRLTNVERNLKADGAEIKDVGDNLQREMTDDMSQKLSKASISMSDGVEVTAEKKGKNKQVKANMKDDEPRTRQSGRLQTKTADTDDIQTPIRSNLRSGRTVFNDQNSSKSQPAKRRGRSAKLIADDYSMKDVADESSEINDKNDNVENGSEPSPLHKNQANNESTTSLEDQIVDGKIASPVLDDKKTIKDSISSNSKTSRKGKPRRKEEIKLANNVSVAVLVEKTTSPPLTDKGVDQKLNEPTVDDEYTNIVHKKIRYMSHSSADEHRKSIEMPKLREEKKEVDNVVESEINTEIVHEKQDGVVPVKDDIGRNLIRNSNEILDTKEVSDTQQITTTANILTSDKTTPCNLIEEHQLTHERLTKTIPKKTFSLDSSDRLSSSSTSRHDEKVNDEPELSSSSNFRQKAPKRYGNTRNLRKSERRKDSESTHTDEISDIVQAIDRKCDEVDRINQKLTEVTSSSNEDTTNMTEILNDSAKEVTQSINPLDQLSETSNSKTSTPEKADTSKELDCFDFTEDECLKPPQVLNRRKRLPPLKMFELEDMDKIEEQRKLDEDAMRIAKEREEDNQKLQAELENLLNTTTPAKLPEIPISLKVHENFPERRAEKDPEKMMSKEDDIKDRTLPPKERKKRIFKYRNRHTDSDTKVTNTNCDAEKNNSFPQPVCFEEKIVTTNLEVVEENQTVLEVVEENQTVEKTEHNNEVEQHSQEKDPSTAHDLQIEIAETLINFPLLSPQIDGSELSHDNTVAQNALSISKESIKRPRKKRTSVNSVENFSKSEPLAAPTQSTVSNESNDLKHKDIKISNELVQDYEHNSKPSYSHVHKTDNTIDKPIDSSPTLQNTPIDTHTNPSPVNESILVATASCSNNTNPSPVNDRILVSTASCSNNTVAINETAVKSIDNDTPSIHQTLEISSTQTVEPINSTAPVTSKSTVLNSARDFSRIRLIEKIDNNAPIQSTEEIVSTKSPHPLPLKKTVIFTQTEGSSFIARIPKKRKSQMDDDIPAFVIERPKDIPDDSTDSHSQKVLTKKEPKSFMVTKTVKKQMTGELRKANVPVIAGNVFVQKSLESSDRTDGNVILDVSQQGNEGNVTQFAANQSSNVNVTPILCTQTTASSETSSIASPVIMSSHIVIHKTSLPSSSQKPSQTLAKRTVSSSAVTVAHSNVLSSLSIANRPCTIAPAKKASYRKPTDMTGLTQKQIGIDGKGNPVMIYTKISPIVTQTPPVQSQATFVMKRTEPAPSTSQLLQSFTTSLQSSPSNQFVITSKGALITNKSFVTTTHAAQINRPNIQMHSQIIRSPNPQMIRQQHQQPNQIVIQTKSTNILSQRTPAPVKRQPTNRRSVVNEDNATIKKRIVRRISKPQSTVIATPHIQPNQHQQLILNTDINQVGSATTPIPPLIPIGNDHLSSVASRKNLKKQPPTQMTFVQEPQLRTETAHIDIIEQQQENMQEILALPGDTFGGPPGSYFLCKLNELGVYIPIDHQPLYLDVTDNTNLLKPNVPEGSMVTEEVAEIQTVEMNETEIVPQQSSTLFQLNSESERVIASNEPELADQDNSNPKYLINISDGQQLLVDQQSLMALANGEDFPQFVTADGHQIILQGGQHDILSAIAFAEDVGLIAGQQILIPEDDLAVIQGQGGNHDILAAALAGTEAFSQEQFIDNVLIQSTNGVEDTVDQIYHTMPQPTVTALTNETNAVLTQPPIMSTLEQPTKTDRLSPNNSLELMGQNLDESLAVIGVTSNTNVPTSLELPITITNPAIAPKTTSMSSAIYPPLALPSAVATEHDLDYDLFSSTLPISHHHLTQSLAINENYRSVNVINSMEYIDSESNVDAVASTSLHQTFETN